MKRNQLLRASISVGKKRHSMRIDKGRNGVLAIKTKERTVVGRGGEEPAW